MVQGTGAQQNQNVSRIYIELCADVNNKGRSFLSAILVGNKESVDKMVVSCCYVGCSQRAKKGCKKSSTPNVIV